MRGGPRLRMRLGGEVGGEGLVRGESCGELKARGVVQLFMHILAKMRRMDPITSTSIEKRMTLTSIEKHMSATSARA